jgi:hypothetical protein
MRIASGTTEVMGEEEEEALSESDAQANMCLTIGVFTLVGGDREYLKRAALHGERARLHQCS